MTGRNNFEESRQLEQAIAALESQRATLGDAMVEAAIQPIRRRLAELKYTNDKPVITFEGERKLVTVMFADFSGFTALAEKQDPETVRELVNACFNRLVPIIQKYEGTVEKFIGDEIMAIFGAPVAHENDPERALRTGLEMMEEMAKFNADHNLDMGMHIGVNTGLVIAGGIGSEGQQQYGVMGDTVNLAKRLEEVAQTGCVLTSHATYCHVRGVFDVLPKEPIRVKGKTEMVRTYLVQRAKPRAFHMEIRGVEGIETRMVGREAELVTLQNVFRDTMEDAETRIVTLVGEAGVGKSRLLYEFDKWIELLPEEIWFFKGWATPEMQASPYGVIRRMFAHRFEILESDSAAEVMAKVRTGMAMALEPNQADLAGHLIGFDFSTSLAVQDMLESESFRKQALAGMTEYFRVVAREPTVIFLEDIHWADDSSLDLIDHLAASLPETRLLVLCLARPALFERRPGWGEGREAHISLELKALSRRESRALVTEILKNVDEIPIDLRDLVVDGAEGNPFYVEELIKMLIDDGVICCEESGWQVKLERLVDVHVPPTLTGVLQARLDSLPSKERALLQRASVVGRLFWDMAVAELAAGEESGFEKDELAPLLRAVRDRELIFRREHSTFIGTDEYTFKHALLRDVTYETVLLKLRRVYHRQVAAWLEAAARDRLGEYLGLIAGHYELAGDQAKAVEYLQRAGDKACLAYAHQEAVEYYRRALTLQKEQGELASAARTLMKLGLVYHTAFDYHRSRQAYEQGFALWQQVEAAQQTVPPHPAPHALRTFRKAPLTLDLTMTDHIDANALVIQLFSGLVEGSMGMEVMPDIAKSWEISEGGQKYVFHLRKDVRWSDGVPVTAGDFEYAWKRTLNPAIGSPNATLLYDIKGARAFHQGEGFDPANLGVQALDDYTLMVELEGPTGYFLSLLAHNRTFPVPRHTLEVHAEKWAQADKLVTNGAFRLESWKPGESMVLTRNPEYHGSFRGNLQRVELSIDIDKFPVLEMYEAGNLDMLGLDALLPSEWDRTRRRHVGEYVSAPESATHYVGFDVSRPPFDDPRVRRAFALATDKTTLANAVLGGYESPATGGFVPPSLPGHSAGIGLGYDPISARQLLAEASYPEGRGFPHVDACARERVRPQAEYLQAQWRENLGIEIPWKIMGWEQYLARLDKVPAHIVQFTWIGDYPDPDSFLRTGNVQQRTCWRDKTFYELVEKARRVMEQEERLKLYAQADRILIEAAAIIPLTYSRSHVLVKPWVHKFPASSLHQWLWKDIILEAH